MLFFSKNCRWPEHYFSVWWLLTTNQFLVSTIFFTNIFFSICVLISFQSSPKSQSNQEQCSRCCSSPCFRVLLCTPYGPLQYFSTYFRKLKEIGVLRPVFPDYVVYCDYVYFHCNSHNHFHYHHFHCHFIV